VHGNSTRPLAGNAGLQLLGLILQALLEDFAFIMPITEFTAI
jgi:hypothetical protein